VIKSNFSGKVSEFLQEQESLFLTENIKSHLRELFNKLSPIEQKIMLQLGNNKQPQAREDLKTELSLSSTDLINGLDSLHKRYLLQIIENDKTLYKLAPIVREINIYNNS
jgi:hypothetical protein